jgi:hypothetical protein
LSSFIIEGNAAVHIGVTGSKDRSFSHLSLGSAELYLWFLRLRNCSRKMSGKVRAKVGELLAEGAGQPTLEARFKLLRGP